MAITLGNYTFEDGRVAVWERIEESGGRDARVLRLKGLVESVTDPEALEAALDAIVAAASAENLTALSLRPGRRLWVRRTGFSREVTHAGRAGAFVLELEAPDVLEEAAAETLGVWNILADGSDVALENAGNAPAPLRLEIAAAADAVNPAFTDGTREIVYLGTLAVGQVLLLDGENARAELDGLEVTSYLIGAFPMAAPGLGTIVFHGEADVNLNATLRFRARWW